MVAVAVVSMPMLTSIIPTPMSGMSAITPLTFVTCVVKAPSDEIGPVLSFENRTIVRIIESVTIMPMPGRISIISVSGIISFVDDYRRRRNPDTNTHMHLRIS
jgi:hypothetical protein